MKNIKFKNTISQKIYDNYIQRIKSTIVTLNKSDREEILLEFNSHIYEALQVDPDTKEEEKLVTITDKLGEPKEVLKPLIAEKKLIQATNTFNPIHVNELPRLLAAG